MNHTSNEPAGRFGDARPWLRRVRRDAAGVAVGPGAAAASRHGTDRRAVSPGDAVGWCAYLGARRLESLLRPERLYALARQTFRASPSIRRASTQLAWQLRGSLPAAWGDRCSSEDAVREEFVRRQLARLVLFWPDRLSSARWRERLTVTGLPEVREYLDAGGTVILAVLHHGPLLQIRYWLRSLGIPTASFADREDTRSSALGRRKDGLSPAFDGVPHTICTTKPRAAMEFLQHPGRALTVAVDCPKGDRARRVDSPACSFLASDTSLRLARRTGAAVVPCSIVEHPRWRFELSFGQPQLVGSSQSEARLRQFDESILAPLLRAVERRPEQCGPEVLRQLA